MMRLGELLKDIYRDVQNISYLNWDIQAISCDSRRVEKDSLFVALKGTSLDGASFIESAIDKGARVIAVERKTQLKIIHPDVCYLYVDDAHQFLRDLAKRFYGNPSALVKTIGVTGTNGKTTITYLVQSIFAQTGQECAIIGTINYKLGNKTIPSANTTPGLLDNQQFLCDLTKEGIAYCVMEVSSHALDQGRIDLIDFKTAVFTNLTSDHLDYHKTRENYFLAKSLLFKNLSAHAAAVINVDDEFGVRLTTMTKAKVITYGIKNNATLQAKDIELNLKGTRFKLIIDKKEISIQTKLFGIHNVYNILAAIGVAYQENISFEVIQKGIEKLAFVNGRLERVDCGQDFAVFIDYAHTEDALINVLSTIRQTSKAKIILVFGCGGDRDKTKRPKMGSVACAMADFSIITSDNPRSEDPEMIIKEIVQGFKKNNYTVVVNREEAIDKALKMATSGDIVLIAGKGHETYQIFKDKTIHFDEREVVRKILAC